jgi:hypothetical protein
MRNNDQENWKIGDEAFAINDIMIQYHRYTKLENQGVKLLVKQDESLLVQDVKRINCMFTLNLGIVNKSLASIVYSCPECKKIHFVCNGEEDVIYLPSFWFAKGKKESLVARLKRALMSRKKRSNSKPNELYSLPIKKKQKKQVPVPSKKPKRTMEEPVIS